MVTHGAAAKMQLRCDVRGPKTTNKQTTDLNFTLAKRVIRGKEDVLGKLRIDDAQACVDAADGVSQLVWGSVFDEETIDTCVKCAFDVAGTPKSGDDEASTISSGDRLSSIYAVHTRHLNIEQRHINAMLSDEGGDLDSG